MMPKVALVFGTRPEAIKLAPIAKILSTIPTISYLGVNTGQHTDLMPSIMERFGITTSYQLNLMVAGQTLIELETHLLETMTQVFEIEHPDAVIVQGDTATAVATALSAFHCGIPVGHVEAGLRTYLRETPFPEETFRRIIATFSHWNFAPSDHAAANLASERVPGKIYVTGNPIVDALTTIVHAPHDSNAWPKQRKQRRIVATIHRRENHPYLPQIFTALSALAQYPDIELFLPLHPNPVVVQAAHEFLSHGQVEIIEPMEYESWIGFLNTADLVISDSGGIQEEAPILGIPLLIAREETERPEVVSGGYGYLVGHNRDRIIDVAMETLNGHVRYARGSPYGDGHAAERIVDHLLGEYGLTASEVMPLANNN